MWLAPSVLAAAQTRRRIVRFGVIALAIALAVTLWAAQPAHARGDDIEVSDDGVHFAAGHSVALFQDVTVAVPGDSQTRSLWVRNTAPSAGYLRIVITNVVSSNPAIARALFVQAKTDAYTGSPVQLNFASPCSVAVEGDLVAPGHVVKVTTTLAMGNLDGADGQGGSASFTVLASFTDAAVGALPPTSCDSTTTSIAVSGPPAVIAMTGSELPYPLLVTGAGALGAGLFLLIAARRRRQEDA